MQSQCDRLLDYLQSHDVIDPLTAWRELGIYRLGSRIFDLRQAGHCIPKEMREVGNRWGEATKVAFYWLEQTNADVAEHG